MYGMVTCWQFNSVVFKDENYWVKRRMDYEAVGMRKKVYSKEKIENQTDADDQVGEWLSYTGCWVKLE